MLISSTQFQQNVGHYLKLAEKGSAIEIIRNKPRKKKYKLIAVEDTKESNYMRNIKKFIKKVEAQGDKFNFYGLDAVNFVRSIRR